MKSSGKHWSATWRAVNDTRYNLLANVLLLTEEYTTGTTCTKYQRLRIILPGMCRMKKKFPCKLLLIWSSKEVTHVIVIYCDVS